MCEFSHENSKLVIIPEFEGFYGNRFFRSNWKEKNLKSLNREYEYKEITSESEYIPKLNEDIGIYSYNNNYNNNYYYYNYNYNNNNNYYNNYYNYYNNYNYNNNNYYYYIKGLVKSYNQVVIHIDKGYRAQTIKLLALLSLADNENKDFLEHFNNHVQKVASKIGCKVIPWQNGQLLPDVHSL